MKNINLILIPILSGGVIFIVATHSAEANPLCGRWKHAEHALPLIPFLFAMFAKLAGLAATIGSGVWAQGKEKNALVPSAIVAAIGGGWCAVTWFGWPMVREINLVHTPGRFFSAGTYDYVETSEFSLLRLIGIGIFGLLGVIIWAVIAFRTPAGNSAEQ